MHSANRAFKVFWEKSSGNTNSSWSQTSLSSSGCSLQSCTVTSLESYGDSHKSGLAITVPILQMGKLRLKALQGLAQGHTQVSRYCGLNVYVSPKFICWSPNLQWDGIQMWSLWEVITFRWVQEGRTLIMGLVPLKEKEEIELSLSFHHVST